MKNFNSTVVTNTVFTPRDSESANAFIKNANRIGQLTPQEETRLGNTLKMGGVAADKAADELVKHNMLLVVSVAKGYLNLGFDFDDLLQVGVEGMIMGVRGFDPAKGRFSTYICPWIKRGIIEALQKEGRLIRIPKNQIELRKKVSDFVYEYGYKPLAAELAEYAGVSYEMAAAALENAPVAELDAPFSDEEEGSTLCDVVKGYDFDDPFVDEVRADMKARITRVLKNSPLQLQAVLWHFGFEGGESLTPEMIATRTGSTDSAVRKLLSNALAKLRDDLSWVPAA